MELVMDGRVLESDRAKVVDPSLEEESSIEEVEQRLDVLVRVCALGGHRAEARRRLLEALGQTLHPQRDLRRARRGPRRGQ